MISSVLFKAIGKGYRGVREAGNFSMKAEGEGVIKFILDHQRGEAPGFHLSAPLRAWFRILRRLELLGRNPQRYGGFAYGNLSRRHKQGFIITCSQTSGLEQLSGNDFAQVTQWSPAANQLRSRGPCRPSSESLTHATIYQEATEAHWVFHAHSPEIWRNAKRLSMPITDPLAEYGTAEMARAMANTLEQMGRPATGIVSLGGHEDGVIAWGTTVEEPGCLLLATLARAITLN
ncbi:MAG TPA: class II aldolase/adducin family protein [Chromatiaceae bacterium]|nr:class II aldolase/adducin family protein [Chromatiaceae bacterium]